MPGTLPAGSGHCASYFYETIFKAQERLVFVGPVEMLISL